MQLVGSEVKLEGCRTFRSETYRRFIRSCRLEAGFSFYSLPTDPHFFVKRLAFLFCLLISSLVAGPLDDNPFGVFDFNLRGETPRAQIISLDGLGFDGFAMQLSRPQELKKLAAYRAARPDFPLLAGYVVFDLKNPKKIPPAHLDRVIARLAELKAPLWIIVNGEKDRRADVIAVLRDTADRCDKAGVQPVLYPHAGSTFESAEEGLEILKELDLPKMKLTLHLCHELRAGNGDRLDEIAKKVSPYLVLASISGANAEMYEPRTRDWSDAIKPLGEGDYDAARLLRALAAVDFTGPIILHTFGLQGKPASHYKRSAKVYREMISGLDDGN